MFQRGRGVASNPVEGEYLLFCLKEVLTKEDSIGWRWGSCVIIGFFYS